VSQDQILSPRPLISLAFFPLRRLQKAHWVTTFPELGNRLGNNFPPFTSRLQTTFTPRVCSGCWLERPALTLVGRLSCPDHERAGKDKPAIGRRSITMAPRRPSRPPW
jgi:hypothetical protein